MNLRCLIVDDEPLARNLLEQYVAKVPYLELVQTCSNAITAIDVLQKQPVDLLFLDVQMPDITGISLLKILPRKPLVVLTTAYSEYALEGYELDVLDYLLKPITFERFLKAANKAMQRASENQPQEAPPQMVVTQPAPAETPQPYLFVKDGTKLVKIRLADILYIEGVKDYVSIHTGEKRVLTHQTLKSLEAQLPENQFVRIHHSYIVGLDWIDSIHKEKVQIGKTLLPISDTYRKAFKDFIEKK
ncbi:MAG: response regulator transcription factor [Saprospiraceae bacterium]|nr:response regulator transcription factor [Saprospiraceae bacterium]